MSNLKHELAAFGILTKSIASKMGSFHQVSFGIIGFYILLISRVLHGFLMLTLNILRSGLDLICPPFFQHMKRSH